MRKIYSHHDRFMVWQIKQLLEQHGIPCFIKNEFAIGAIGELSPFDVLPEVWLTDDDWLPKAQRTIEDFEAQPELKTAWLCEQCHETNGANFELCWQCGSLPQNQ
jgi:hypothetical protein